MKRPNQAGPIPISVTLNTRLALISLPMVERVPDHSSLFEEGGGVRRIEVLIGRAIISRMLPVVYPERIYLFIGRCGQQATFYIQFSFCGDCVSVAPTVQANPAGIAIPARQGFDVHLHG
ncbi:hypothetical protein IVB55_31585 [Bradyrhizobium sp. CW4]|uniref:hypothetical protein n=1 Tax=Bradyrhizobium sp. CW4 TaxID=2782687 RepID=UPI001FFA0348|nr:hypothetical protein [Bradyrhizobium sp. CW4]MCK1417417.1 hypothetical protein [Bradyrhizobium sp. CW4]